ncbi:hypothetical protein RZS08_51365, partial [Arthrospira platensis SPKY1]|nr:hypothetical protein [Arthrospira platensis SPKY1]
PGASDGPYAYSWNNGEATQTLSGLTPGEYTVTVTDGFGCTDTLTVVVDITSSTASAPQLIRSLSIAPNPTNGLSALHFAFERPLNARIQVFNAVGQLIFDAQD